MRCFTRIALFTCLCVDPFLAAAELRFCLHTEPKTLNPLLADDDASIAVRYLTGGVLIRLNRLTQELQPELAASWNITDHGKSIQFKLRRGVLFSDGTPFTAADVAYTFTALMDPKLQSPTADPFRSAQGAPTVRTIGDDVVQIAFPAPVSALERLFDDVTILSAKSPLKERAVLGAFQISSYRPGSEITLKRNPRYWKHDGTGRPLPYADGVRLYIQQNRNFELIRFRRGELDLIEGISPDNFEQLARQMPNTVRDLGPSLDSEMLWFNQVSAAPV